MYNKIHANHTCAQDAYICYIRTPSPLENLLSSINWKSWKRLGSKDGTLTLLASFAEKYLAISKIGLWAWNVEKRAFY